MADQIYIGNFAKGLKLDRLPFNIDNDAFPTLYNFYSWRGRAKRKRGTLFLGQLQNQIKSVVGPTLPWQSEVIYDLDGSGNGTGNLISIYSLGSSATIAARLNSSTTSPIQLTDGTNTYTEPSIPDGTLVGSPSGSGTINYATGQLTITGGAPAGHLIGLFSYYPGLPVMGLCDLVTSSSNSQFPLLMAFDTKYSYQVNQTTNVVNFYNTTYYKNSNVPFTWLGQDYQLFWSTNYPSTTINFSGSFWATNNKPGFHFLNGTYTSGSPGSSINFNFKSFGQDFLELIVGDKLFFNEWSTLTYTIGGANANGIVGTVSAILGGTGNYSVTFDSPTLTSVTISGTGIVQTLTNSVPVSLVTPQDGIRWYDGDPTSATGIPTGTGLGWVNFAPPLSALNFSINSTTPDVYYLVGALAIVPFKDRLLFFSPYIQSKSNGPFLLQDTVIWSWNGTPYYNSLVPLNQTFDNRAYYVDQTGFGGYLPAGISSPILTVANNEDVILVGFGGDGRKTRFVYTGNDLQPFLFFNINSEIPSGSTFSTVVLDKGAIDIGQYGLAMTDQQSSQRIDLDIPDTIFTIQSLNSGDLRVNSARDFFKEWIYFSYPIDDSSWKFPTQTLLFNYRDNTWGVFYENFTVHGNYRAQNNRSWTTLPFKTWATWREAWNSGSSAALDTQIIAGNPQGFVLIKGQGTGEAQSGTILSISNSSGNTQINSIDHCVEQGDYLYISGCLGTTDLNTQIGIVTQTIDANNFVMDLPFPSGTYLGLGVYTRLSQPFLQTKQFPFYWEQGRQVRLCSQKYLMDFTADAQVTICINLSQDPTSNWNDPLINGTPTNSLIYSQIMFTCPESTNLGLTPSNTNLQTPTASTQKQIWHRYSTMLSGDSVQLQITLSDAQMRNLTYATSEITLHGIQLTVAPGALLA